ncbi:DinB family protein [Kineococcus gynurae]|uniref:DinB family protein n=1 Tax=Kineococcus gynurae TaxID=452979 RepID=A0ABV5LWI8_9ACTN
MTPIDLLTDAHARIPGAVHGVLDGLDPAHLTARPDPGTNSIAWLLWHLTRVQDDHVAGVAGREQVWTAQGWARRFALPLDDADTGYQHTPEQVAVVDASAADLAGYHDAVHEHTRAYLETLSPDDLDRVVDDAWDPPVTLGVRLVSVIDDDVAHAAQAMFLRGILQRAAGTTG